MLRFNTFFSRTIPTVAKNATTRRCLVAKYHAASNETIEFGGDRDGLNYDLNWSLNADGVTPRGNAFHNMTFERLKQVAGEIKYDGADTTIQHVGTDIRYGEYEKVSNAILESLSSVENLYTCDGAVGSYAKDRSRVRVISDSPLVAHLARNVLSGVKVSFEAERQIVVYVTSQRVTDDESSTAVMIVGEDQLGESGVAPVKLFFSGIPSSKTFLQALGKAKHTLMAADETRDGVLLPCDMMTLDGKTAMVFNASDESKTHGVTSNVLHSAHFAIWSQDGVSPLFGGAVVAATGTTTNKSIESQESAIFLDGGKAVSISQPTHNLLDHPDALVFVGSSKKVSSKQAAGVIAKAYPDFDDTLFQTLIKEHSPALVGVAKEADIAKILSK